MCRIKVRQNFRTEGHSDLGSFFLLSDTQVPLPLALCWSSTRSANMSKSFSLFSLLASPLWDVGIYGEQFWWYYFNQGPGPTCTFFKREHFFKNSWTTEWRIPNSGGAERGLLNQGSCGTHTGCSISAVSYLNWCSSQLLFPPCSSLKQFVSKFQGNLLPTYTRGPA